MIRTMFRPAGLAAGLLVLVSLGGAGLAAQKADGKLPSRPSAPSGAEIAAAARAGRLDTANVGTATMFGKPFKFTPVQPGSKADPPDAGKGVFLGVLENGAVGDETGLPPGKYNLFVADVNGQIKGYAEANGRIVKEAIRANVTPAPEGARTKPVFQEKGWSVRVYVCSAVFVAGRRVTTCVYATLYF